MRTIFSFFLLCIAVAGYGQSVSKNLPDTAKSTSFNKKLVTQGAIKAYVDSRIGIPVTPGSIRNGNIDLQHYGLRPVDGNLNGQQLRMAAANPGFSPYYHVLNTPYPVNQLTNLASSTNTPSYGGYGEEFQEEEGNPDMVDFLDFTSLYLSTRGQSGKFYMDTNYTRIWRQEAGPFVKLTNTDISLAGKAGQYGISATDKGTFFTVPGKTVHVPENGNKSDTLATQSYVMSAACGCSDDFKEDKANKGQPDGYTPLNSNGKIDTAYLPSQDFMVLLAEGLKHFPGFDGSKGQTLQHDNTGKIFWGDAVASSLTRIATPSLKAISASTSGIDLSWTDVANETSYELQWSADGLNNWTNIGGAIAANTTSFSHTGLASNKQYFYRLRGIGDGVTYSTGNWGEANATLGSATAALPGDYMTPNTLPGGVTQNPTGQYNFTTQTDISFQEGFATSGSHHVSYYKITNRPGTADEGITFSYFHYGQSRLTLYKGSNGNIFARKNAAEDITDSGIPFADNTLIGIERLPNNQIRAVFSLNNGTTWTSFYDYTNGVMIDGGHVSVWCPNYPVNNADGIIREVKRLNY